MVLSPRGKQMAAKKKQTGNDKMAKGTWAKAESFLAEGNYAAARRLFKQIQEEDGESDVAQKAAHEAVLLNVDRGALVAAACFLTIYVLLWLMVLN